jgi:hypothetical protein
MLLVLAAWARCKEGQELEGRGEGQKSWQEGGLWPRAVGYKLLLLELPRAGGARLDAHVCHDDAHPALPVSRGRRPASLQRPSPNGRGRRQELGQSMSWSPRRYSTAGPARR